MENVGIDGGFWKGKRVLITGHTGFKGSWLALWLSHLGARVAGYSLQPPTEPSHYRLLELDVDSVHGDIRDLERLERFFKGHGTDIVFHLAAQSIVRRSYDDPVATFATNVLGTVNVLQAARTSGTVRAVVNVTSDKCYENREWPWGYREIDPVGGYDPYSASKGCAEIVTGCWRNSFFNPRDHGRTHQTLIASVRAGNVIGGGDWATDRLVPDVMRAAGGKRKAAIRNPNAVRPWQHVLDPLRGYLLLGQKLLEGDGTFAEAWNFGPAEEGIRTVGDIVRQLKGVWPRVDYDEGAALDQPHEATLLRLDSSKSRMRLHWVPVWDSRTAVERTASWYRAYYEDSRVQSVEDLRHYMADAARGRNPGAAG